MQTLDINRPGMPDLEFILLVSALCTSPLAALNIPARLRTIVFDRCWVLIHASPPPEMWEKRVLDLLPWNEVTLDAMVDTIQGAFTDAGIRTLTWNLRPAIRLGLSHRHPLITPLDVRLRPSSEDNASS